MIEVLAGRGTSKTAEGPTRRKDGMSYPRTAAVWNAVTEMADACERHQHLGQLVQEDRSGFEAMRMPAIVGVQRRDQLSRGQAEPKSRAPAARRFTGEHTTVTGYRSATATESSVAYDHLQR